MYKKMIDIQTYRQNERKTDRQTTHVFLRRSQNIYDSYNGSRRGKPCSKKMIDIQTYRQNELQADRQHTYFYIIPKYLRFLQWAQEGESMYKKMIDIQTYRQNEKKTDRQHTHF